MFETVAGLSEILSGGHKMSYILLGVLFVTLFGCKYKKEGFHQGYIDKEQTTCINGVFVLLIFMSHFAQYRAAVKGSFYLDFKSQHGQLVVVTFLFYSGYGIMWSILKKGRSYVLQLPLRRLLVVWVHFALALLLFVASNIYLGYKYSLKNTVLSFFGWSSIGNSNWYIFSILALYVMTFIAFTVFKDHTKAIICMFALTFVFMTVLSHYKDAYWYNTVILYPIGMLFAYKRKPAEAAVMRSEPVYWGLFINAVFWLIAFSYIWPASKWMLVPFECKAIAFMVCVVLLTMKFSIKNKALSFFGKYTFEVYILQRIPARLFVHKITNTYILFAVCFVITIVLAVVFRFLTDRLDKLWNKILDKFCPKPI